MTLKVIEPSPVDADKKGDAYAMRFYRGRKHAYAHMFEVVDHGGTVVGRYFLRVHPTGALSLELLEEINVDKPSS